MKEEKLGKISNVSLYGSRQQEGHVAGIMRLIDTLLQKGVKVSVERKLADTIERAGYRLSVHGVAVCGKVPADTQAAISVGGDGTFLRTAKWLAMKEIPIIGINTGHLGFLAENSTDDPDEVVDMITGGNALIERRQVLHVECDAIPKTEWPYALNEVAFLKGAASMIDIDVNLDGYHLATYRADGLLVATPTGSTAYNLSVGGPILAPTLDNIILSPIAPHTLTLRPVVVGGHSRIEASVSSRAADFRLSLDGRAFPVGCGVKVTIRRADHCVLTVRKEGQNFASTLRSKLLWGS